MSKRKPPSQRPERRRNPKPSGDKHPTHDELLRLVDQNTEMLKLVWDRRRNDSDIVVLADVRRTELRHLVEEYWGPVVVAIALAESHATGDRKMLAFIQPSTFADSLRGGDTWSHRETGKELHAFVKMAAVTPGLVPLLVVCTGGLWATQWADPESNVEVIRYAPEVTPGWN
ncbi:hypothetical protein [Singulisphaera acidiphila]|uniref:hypothetical protein n=1 Tax=Singulisphaera acidiphila TaxID=466153 RepID=UPI0002471A98|nr:hypothetical protein [Singulisphaera acidiphila]